MHSVHVPLKTRADLLAEEQARAATLPPSAGPREVAEGDRQARAVQDHPVYAGMVREMDETVATVLAAVEAAGQTDNTLVVFTSDNGGIADPDSRNVADAIEAGLAVKGPLRAGKHSIYEGGFREPFLVRWPGHVPAGTVSHQVIGLVDVFATLADILGVGRPLRGAEDSVSVLRAFTEAEPGPPVRDHVVMQGADATYALRMGDWKLIERVGAPPFEPRPRKKATDGV
jgi:arylsulfatase A-like enzyme